MTRSAECRCAGGTAARWLRKFRAAAYHPPPMATFRVISIGTLDIDRDGVAVWQHG